MRKLGKRGQIESGPLLYLAIGFIVVVVIGLVWYSVNKGRSIGIGKVEQGQIDIAVLACQGFCDSGKAPNYYCNEPIKIPFTDTNGKKNEIWSSCYDMAQTPKIVKDQKGNVITGFPVNIDFPDCNDVYNCKKGAEGYCVANAVTCTTYNQAMKGCKKDASDPNKYVINNADCKDMTKEQCSVSGDACEWQATTPAA